MRWIITVVVVAGKEQNSRPTVRPTDQTTPGQADDDDIACPQDEERRHYDGLRSGGTVGKEGMLSGVRRVKTKVFNKTFIT